MSLLRYFTDEAKAERQAYSEYIADRFPKQTGGQSTAPGFNKEAMEANLAARVDIMRGRSDDPVPETPVAPAPLTPVPQS